MNSAGRRNARHRVEEVRWKGRQKAIVPTLQFQCRARFTNIDATIKEFRVTFALAKPRTTATTAKAAANSTAADPSSCSLCRVKVILVHVDDTVIIAAFTKVLSLAAAPHWKPLLWSA